MARAKNKTTENEGDVRKFLDGIEDPVKKENCDQILEMMSEITGETPKMWGVSIVGFGKYQYKYESGREGESLKVGFSPRKNSLTLYIMPGFDRYQDLMGKLGKHKTGKSCLYIKRLDDIDGEVLRNLVKSSYEYMTDKYG